VIPIQTPETRECMAGDQAQLEAALNAIVEPELGLALGELGMVRGVGRKRRRARIELALPVAAWPGTDALADDIQRVALGVPGVEEVEFEVGVMTDQERAALRQRLRADMLGDAPAPDDADQAAGHAHAHDHGHSQGADPLPAFLSPESKTRVIGVSSGKGGVGKSTVTVNLAVALAQDGYDVGLLDADVYGFSVPKMLGTDHDPVILGDIVVPTSAHGVRCLSMGYFVPDDQPVIWRGPMLHKAIQQFLTDAYWGLPDFVLIDMPPGTGDVALTLAEVMPRAEVIVVTTPQPAAQRVAQRSAFAARRLKLSVRGVVENMSWFTGDDGKRYELFGSGGGETLAHDLGVPLLGRVPLVSAVRLGGDEGRPVTAVDPQAETAKAFRDIAGKLAALGPARVYRRELSLR
jgi:ATP-binding protein involved in chromosome partitioning